MDRRSFLKTIAFALASGFITRDKAYALELDDYVALSPAIAKEIAEVFAAQMTNCGDYIAQEPIEMFDDAYNLVGYEVDYLVDGSPSGYVLLDSREYNLIPRYSLSKGSMGIYAALNKRCSQYNQLSERSPSRLVSINPLDFALGQDDLMLRNDGSLVSSRVQMKSPPISSWDQLMVPSSSLDYDIQDICYGNIVAQLDIATVEDRLSRYTCGVSALYCIAATLPYPSYSAFNRFLINLDDYAQYTTLWSLTRTYVTHVSGGISYGMTNFNDLGPGFKSFCQERQRTIGFWSESDPQYSTYRAQALDGTHSLFCAVVNVADKNGNVTQSGHIMAADGVACFGPKGTGISDQYIHVYDGWSSHVFIRKNHSAYTNKFGVYFTK